ncbi:MAG TPA: hypothetical protein VJJ23_06655 [Candidatus Nanoarchaeia archaeon]|nr:hypothetical protein [Candidatus Nanoarchaeia archaeon]
MTTEVTTEREVLPMLKNVYDRYERVDLHREKGLHGIEEVTGLVELVNNDKEILALARLACESKYSQGDRMIGIPFHSLDPYATLKLDGNGFFVYWPGYEDIRPGFLREIGRELRTNLYNNLKIINGSSLQTAILNFIREAPHGTFKEHKI